MRAKSSTLAVRRTIRGERWLHVQTSPARVLDQVKQHLLDLRTFAGHRAELRITFPHDVYPLEIILSLGILVTGGQAYNPCQYFNGADRLKLAAAATTDGEHVSDDPADPIRRAANGCHEFDYTPFLHQSSQPVRICLEISPPFAARRSKNA